MRKFKFNLQRVLDYRETVEESLVVELAAIRADHEREMDNLLRLLHTRDAFTEKLRMGLVSSDPEEMRDACRYQQELLKQVTAQEIVVQRLEEKRDKKLAQVVKASKDRKTLDRLRANKAKDHRREELQLEQDFLDDVAGPQHRRNAHNAHYATGGPR